VNEPGQPVRVVYWRSIPIPRRESPWRTHRLNGLLFLLTVASIALVGGLRLVLALVPILMAHEMGHYLACRFYRVQATLPFFIPLPVPELSLVGTAGAFIRIRSPIPHRHALFDIGIAGPLAGFLVCLPVLGLGMMEAQLQPVAEVQGIFLGEPLLFQWATRLVWGEMPPGVALSLGPIGLAAWFGLLVTALNLSPIGQLDGGHISYALLRERAYRISQIGSWVCVLLVYFGPSWLVWALLVRVLGRKHPPTFDDNVPLGRGRVLLGVVALLVFVICFTPNPIVWSWAEFFRAVRG